MENMNSVALHTCDDCSHWDVIYGRDYKPTLLGYYPYYQENRYFAAPACGYFKLR